MQVKAFSNPFKSVNPNQIPEYEPQAQHWNYLTQKWEIYEEGEYYVNANYRDEIEEAKIAVANHNDKVWVRNNDYLLPIATLWLVGITAGLVIKFMKERDNNKRYNLAFQQAKFDLMGDEEFTYKTYPTMMPMVKQRASEIYNALLQEVSAHA